MASTAFPSLAKSIKTKDGTTYGFVHVPAKDPSKKRPSLLFIHGYPSSSYDWRYQIETFSKEGYELIVPDLLGYGDTDKPTSPQDYSMVRIGGHVEEICDYVGAKDNVVAIAHDWGAGLLSAMIKQSQERYVGFVFVAVGYQPQSVRDVDGLNAMTQQKVGYPMFGYWKFHNQEDAAGLIEKNVESYMSLVYPEDPQLWITDLCPIGKVREWTESGTTKSLPPWLPKDEHDLHVQIMQKGGWAGPLNWYKQSMAGVTTDAEGEIPDEQKIVKKPLFFIGASKDYVCLEAIHRPSSEQWSKSGFETISIDACHWVYLEKRKEFDDALSGWLDKTFANGAKI